MDLDGNGEITEEEFINRCLEDEYLGTNKGQCTHYTSLIMTVRVRLLIPQYIYQKDQFSSKDFTC